MLENKSCVFTVNNLLDRIDGRVGEQIEATVNDESDTSGAPFVFVMP
jgi:hypothetical protein